MPAPEQYILVVPIPVNRIEFGPTCTLPNIRLHPAFPVNLRPLSAISSSARVDRMVSPFSSVSRHSLPLKLRGWAKAAPANIVNVAMIITEK
jgi:hypothetical protein